MRVIIDDSKLIFFDNTQNNALKNEYGYAYRKYDTIEITDEEWDKIGDGYRPFSRKLSKTYKPLSIFLHELFELKGEVKND